MTYDSLKKQWDLALQHKTVVFEDLVSIDEELATDPSFEDWEALQDARHYTVQTLASLEQDVIEAEEAIFYQILFRSGWDPEIEDEICW